MRDRTKQLRSKWEEPVFMTPQLWAWSLFLAALAGCWFMLVISALLWPITA